MRHQIIAAVIVATSFAGAAASAQTPSEDASRTRAETIFDASRAAVNRLQMPPYIAFTLQDDGHTDYAAQEEKVRLLVRSSDGAAVVVPLKSPNGVPISQPVPLVIRGPISSSITYISRVGDFALYDFGLRYNATGRPGLFDAPGTPEPVETPGKSIAVVRAFNPNYYIVDVGDTTINGVDVYHLRLTPLKDPGHHVLREIWIDRTTSLPVRYVAEVPVSYAGEGQVVDQEATIYPAMLEGHLTNTRVDGHFRIVVGIDEKKGSLKWELSDISFPASEPDWVFDIRQWPQHQGETIPNLSP